MHAWINVLVLKGTRNKFCDGRLSVFVSNWNIHLIKNNTNPYIGKLRCLFPPLTVYSFGIASNSLLLFYADNGGGSLPISWRSSEQKLRFFRGKEILPPDYNIEISSFHLLACSGGFRLASLHNHASQFLKIMFVCLSVIYHILPI